MMLEKFFGRLGWDELSVGLVLVLSPIVMYFFSQNGSVVDWALTLLGFGSFALGVLLVFRSATRIPASDVEPVVELSELQEKQD